MLTQERLKTLVSYDPETGVFSNLVARPNLPFGAHVGWASGNGYRSASIDGVTYRLNRLAWLYMTGEWPPEGYMVDHANRDRTDDRWANLRLANPSQNSANAQLSKRNSSGHKGIYWYARHGKWNAQIRVNRRLLSLGYFNTIDAAVSARKAAEQRYFGEFAA